MQVIRIPNAEKLQHYKTRSAPWVKSHRHDLMPERPEGRAYLALSLAARGLLADLQRLAVETGNATPLYLDWLNHRLCTGDDLVPLLEELLAKGRLELAENAISPAITDASRIASVLSSSRIQGVNPSFSRSAGSGEREEAGSRPTTRRNASASGPRKLGDVLPAAGKIPA